MSDTVDAALNRLTRVRGVQGAAVVDSEAGVSVSSELAEGVRDTALAAMAGSLFDQAVDASRSSGFGGVRLLQLDARDAHVVIADAGPLLVVVLTEPDAQLGLVRVEAGRAAEELSE